ncbi:hypothetical protein ACFQ40_00005 [Kroppenstedtia eburnea]|uniref:hypothetical protein n=1 Tax=Kroppenstedtia eburnea TaxID=714067 RepID=UPI003625336D
MSKKDEYQVNIPAGTPNAIREALQEEWEKGGAKRLGELVLIGLEESLPTSGYIAKIKGLTPRATSKAAQDAAESGAAWPRKSSKGAWIAPMDQWEKLLDRRMERRPKNRKY